MRFFVYASLLFLTSCASKKVQLPPVELETTHFEESYNYYFWGLSPKKREVSEAELCPNGRLQSLTYRKTPLDIFLHYITVGIYSPKTLEGQCTKSL